jgi:hypothetical protein
MCTRPARIVDRRKRLAAQVDTGKAQDILAEVEGTDNALKTCWIPGQVLAYDGSKASSQGKNLGR